jgi:peroxiredoxin
MINDFKVLTVITILLFKKIDYQLLTPFYRKIKQAIMRQLFILLTLLLCINIQAREITILAKIKNPTVSEINFSFTIDALIEENKLTIANLNERNEAYFILDFQGSNIVTVNYNDYYFDIFIENENRIEFTFDTKDIINSLKFSGETATNNNAFAKYRKQFESSKKIEKFNKGYLSCNLLAKDVADAKSKELKDYEEDITASFKEKMNYAQSLNTISSGFKIYLNRKISYGTGISRLAYFIVNEAKMTPYDIEKAEIRHEFKTKNKQENDALTHTDYTNFWISYIYFNYLRKEYKDPNPGFGFYEIGNKELKSETRDWTLSKLLINAKKENYIAIANQKFDSFKENISHEKYINKVAKYYDGIIQLSDEDAAPEFLLKDKNGKIRSLSEFQGQIVYISYWATWCKPCLMGFRKTIAVRNQMKDIGVILLNICLDEQESTWYNTMGRIPMPGVNLYAGNDEELKLNYDLSKLPAYYIIDKEGNFAYLPEGSRDILAEFRKMVRE